MERAYPCASVDLTHQPHGPRLRSPVFARLSLDLITTSTDAVELAFPVDVELPWMNEPAD